MHDNLDKTINYNLDELISPKNGFNGDIVYNPT